MRKILLKIFHAARIDCDVIGIGIGLQRMNPVGFMVLLESENFSCPQHSQSLKTKMMDFIQVNSPISDYIYLFYPPFEVSYLEFFVIDFYFKLETQRKNLIMRNLCKVKHIGMSRVNKLVNGHQKLHKVIPLVLRNA